MRVPAPSRRSSVHRTGLFVAYAAGAAVSALVLSACSAAQGATPSSPSVAAPSSAGSTATVVVEPAGGSAPLKPSAQVVVRASSGTLADVAVRSTRTGTPLPGSMSLDRTVWTSTAGALLPLATRFAVTAQAIDADGRGKVVRSTFATVTPKATLKTIVTPGDGRLVGVGMPLMVEFTAPVKNRAAVEAALEVESSKPVDGAWYWLSDTAVHYRPKDFWPAGSQITVRFKLAGVDAGGGVWGAKDRTIRFTVGDAMVSTVDVTAHTLTVTRNGKVLRVIPVTTGKDGFLTRGGIKVIVSKERERVMDSSTVDIPANSADSYRLKVEYAMRLTWSGEFLHAAPWSVRHQGRDNVSHGCTGMSNENAAWLYSVSRPGDVVRYVHSTRSLEPGNGYTDWNVSWDKWQAGSAL